MTNDSGHLIAVLGMHRSGTSAVARSLQVLGVSLGEKLMPAHEQINAKGFWEDIDFVNFNIEVGQVLGRAWHSVAPLSDADFKLLAQTDLADRALELTKSKLSANKIYGLKDPRLANLSPFWLPVFRKTGATVSAVLSIRHPASVAQSLVKRDGFSTEHSYLLWIDHVLSSAQSSAAEKRIVVDYDLLMADPQGQLKRMSEQLGLPLIDSELTVFKNEFLDDTLRHTAYSLSDLDADPSCPAIVRDCYRLLLDAAKDDIDVASDSFKQKIGDWYREHERNLPMLQLLDERWKDNATLEHHLNTHRERIVGLNEEKNSLGRAKDALVSEKTSLTQEISRQSAIGKRLESEVTKLESARSALEARSHELVDQLGREKSIAADRQASLNRLNRTLNNKEREIIDIRNSTSWRVTAPIRWLRELFMTRK